VKLGDPLKEKCLCITVTLGLFELSKVFALSNCCWGPIESKVAYYTLQLLLRPFESKVLHTLQLLLGACYCGPLKAEYLHNAVAVGPRCKADACTLQLLLRAPLKVE